MAGSIKLFQFLKKTNTLLGISESQSERKQWSRKTIFLICYTPCAVSAFGYVVFDAKSMFEYALGFYMSISAANTISIYLLFRWQSENMLESIANCEKFIAKSKYEFCLLLFCI